MVVVLDGFLLSYDMNRVFSLRLSLFGLIIFFCGQTVAQEGVRHVSDEELKGVWVYTSYSIGGKVFDNDFLSIKIYGDDGEYCCARAQKLNCGTYRILPVDYGTYVYRNGEYTECGRKGNLNLVSETSFNGMYIGRRECWEKVVDFPAELRRYIVEECRKAVLGDAQIYQEMMEKHWINR